MKQKSKFFLVYSIALFSVALILILFSTFTGMRYKEDKESAQGLYANAKSSAEALTRENENLRDEISKREDEISEQQNQTERLEKLIAIQVLLNEGTDEDLVKAKEAFASFTAEEEKSKELKKEEFKPLSENAQMLFEQINATISYLNDNENTEGDKQNAGH